MFCQGECSTHHPIILSLYRVHITSIGSSDVPPYSYDDPTSCTFLAQTSLIYTASMVNKTHTLQVRNEIYESLRNY